MYADGQRRWPSVHLGFEAFRSHCREVLGPDPAPETLAFGADLYLCCACAARDPQAALTFERETTSTARNAIARIQRDPEFVTETLRVLLDKLLYAADPGVKSYSAKGPLQAWAGVAAARTAIDRWRARRLSWTRHVDLGDYFGSGGSGLESSLTKARYHEAFQRALQHALAALSPQDRNLLRMHVLDRCSIDQIGRAYSVHRATAARWLERARTKVREAVREELCLEHARLTDSEFMSIAHLMGGELELTLATDMNEPAESRSVT